MKYCRLIILMLALSLFTLPQVFAASTEKAAKQLTCTLKITDADVAKTSQTTETSVTMPLDREIEDDEYMSKNIDYKIKDEDGQLDDRILWFQLTSAFDGSKSKVMVQAFFGDDNDEVGISEFLVKTTAKNGVVFSEAITSEGRDIMSFVCTMHQ